MDVSFIVIEEEDSLFSSLFSSEALTTRKVLRLLLFLSLSFRFVFFAHVFCFVVVCFVVVIEEGGRPPLPLRRRPNAPRPPRGQKNAFAFSEKAKDDANIVVFCRRRRQSESVVRAKSVVCALNRPHFALCVYYEWREFHSFRRRRFPTFVEKTLRKSNVNVYLRDEDDDDEDDDESDEESDNDDDEKSFSLLFAKIRFF